MITKFRTLFILIIAFLFSCENHQGNSVEFLDSQETGISQEVTQFHNLPMEIQNLVSANHKELQAKSNSHITGKSFGDIAETAVVSNWDDESTVYTIGLEHAGGPQFENIVITVDSTGATQYNTVRYIPNEQWYAENWANEHKYDSYTGDIEVFDQDGVKYFDESLLDGEGTLASSTTSRSTCHVKVQTAYGCSDGCWIYSITIDIICGGGPTPPYDGGDGGQDDGGRGGGFGGGGSGGGSGQLKTTTVEVPVLPPDCESFEFIKVGNNQFSYVKGIRFLVIDAEGERHYLRYDNPMEFSAPYEDRFGNIYKPGYLAEASARALKQAMDKTKDYVLSTNSYLGEYRTKRFFEDRLKETYPDNIPGGRVQVRPNKRHVNKVTDYKSTWWMGSIGDCDDDD